MSNQGQLRSKCSAAGGWVVGAEKCGLCTAWDKNKHTNSELTIDHSYGCNHLCETCIIVVVGLILSKKKKSFNIGNIKMNITD